MGFWYMWNEEFLLKHVEFLYRRVELSDMHFLIRSSIVETHVFANWAFGLGLEELVQLSFEAAIAILQNHGSH